MRINTCATDWQAWDEYVTRHPSARLYHLSRWRDVIQQSMGHRYHALAAMEDGRIAGVLPLVHLNSWMFGSFLVSLPYFNYGGILADSPDVARLLYAQAGDLADQLGARHVELRQAEPLVEDAPTKTHKVAMHLALPDDPDVLWESLKPKVRNQIRKPQKAGLVARHGHLDLLDDFYTVFARNMRDLGTPVYAKAFFRTILEAFPQRSHVVTVYLADEQTCVAAGFLLGDRRMLEIPWASSLRSHNSLSPNNLLYWEVLRYGCEQGYGVFDFGRSSKDSGTYRFKKQWGAEPVPLHWQYWLPVGGELPELNPQNARYQRRIALWRRMPVWLTRLVGPHIVRNLP